MEGLLVERPFWSACWPGTEEGSFHLTLGAVVANLFDGAGSIGTCEVYGRSAAFYNSGWIPWLCIEIHQFWWKNCYFLTLFTHLLTNFIFSVFCRRFFFESHQTGRNSISFCEIPLVWLWFCLRIRSYLFWNLDLLSFRYHQFELKSIIVSSETSCSVISFEQILRVNVEF